MERRLEEYIDKRLGPNNKFNLDMAWYIGRFFVTEMLDEMLTTYGDDTPHEGEGVEKHHFYGGCLTEDRIEELMHGQKYSFREDRDVDRISQDDA